MWKAINYTNVNFFKFYFKKHSELTQTSVDEVKILGFLLKTYIFELQISLHYINGDYLERKTGYRTKIQQNGVAYKLTHL